MIVDASENNEAGNYRINNNKTRISKSFECKTKITENTPANNHRLNTEVVVPLEYLNYFWRSLDLPLSNCKIELDFVIVGRLCNISNIENSCSS